MALTPAERHLRAKLAAHEMHAKHPVEETSRAGREAFLDGWLTKADPEGVLPEAERQRRAQHLLKAHMTRLSLAASKARRAKAGQS